MSQTLELPDPIYAALHEAADAGGTTPVGWIEARLAEDKPEGSRWNTWFERLEACRALKEGWNGYTAPAPAADSIENARTFLEALRHAKYEPTRLAPSAMGGVAVTRRSGDRKVMVEFYNDGRAYALFSNRDPDMRVTPIATNCDAYAAFIVEMRAYLNG